MAFKSTSKAQLYFAVYVLLIIGILVNSIIAIIAPDSIDTTSSPVINTSFGVCLVLLLLYGVLSKNNVLFFHWDMALYCLAGFVMYFFLNISTYLNYTDNEITKLYVGKGLYCAQIIALLIALGPSTINSQMLTLWYINKNVAKMHLDVPFQGPPPPPIGGLLKPFPAPK